MNAPYAPPFDPDTQNQDLEPVLALPLFRAVNEANFPPGSSLRDILVRHARVRHCRRGDIVVRRGDYGHTVFGILKGRLRVLVDPGVEKLITARPVFDHKPWFTTLLQTWRTPNMPEIRHDEQANRFGFARLRRAEEIGSRLYLEDPETVITAFPTRVLVEGQSFGMIAALARSARTATVFAESDATLLELRWQGLQEIRYRDVHFRKYLDGLYGSRALANHLLESVLFATLERNVLDVLTRETEFETYGSFEWTRTFKQAMARGVSTIIEYEPVVVDEGQPLDHLLVVCSGFARVSVRHGSSYRTEGFVARNEMIGLEEILTQEHPVYRHRVSAIGHVDVLKVPVEVLQAHVLPRLSADFTPRPVTFREGGPPLSGREQALIDFFIDNRFINGTAVMLIDLDRCTECDECVRACSLVHDNNPRFLRHGRDCTNIMVANACMHCVDPVCLIGCPTGAIHRLAQAGRVVIDETLCIGCATCADSCPYDDIRMVEIRDSDGRPLRNGRQPTLRATKCDLCPDVRGGPACQRACATEALVRIDMRDRYTLARWLARS
ncbi:MAG: hypothetical protein FD149_36 [Rhodospirillaceae bacterium]|nr:MAG: hypothetical protein FD149_36 [Rhodospirillaceae bacterium]